MGGRLKEEGGFTLTEVMITCVLMIVVLGPVYATFNQFERTERVNQQQNDAQQEARRASFQLARDLRNLAANEGDLPLAVEKAGPYDLVFLSVDPDPKPAGSLNSANTRRVRYCLGPSAGGKAKLYMQAQTWTAAAKPASPSTASCPDDAWPSLPEGSINARSLADDLVNGESGAAIFSYDSADLSRVTLIRTNLEIDVNPGERPAVSRLASGVFLRNQNRAPTVDFTATDTGTGHRVLLNGSASDDPEGKTLSNFLWYVDGDLSQPIASGTIAYWTAPPGVFPRNVDFTLRVQDPTGSDLWGESTKTVEVQ